MKLLAALKVVNMLWGAMGEKGYEKKRRGMNMAIRYMRRSGFAFDYISLVSAHLANLERKVFDSLSTSRFNANRSRNLHTANITSRRIRSSGLRSLGKAYRVRCFRFALGALHRDLRIFNEAKAQR